jgi:asparagine synthase (glutamine-hydrolysing)
MCGICGVVMLGDRSPDRAVVDAMCTSLTHRGPDDSGLWTGDGVALAMRRLSIIDLAGGHQPISNEDGSAWIVFNGEIYNFPTLREELLAAGHVFRTHTDTECVVHGYEEWGDELPTHLNGMFAYAIWDRHHRRLTLARDRLGIKPLHYALLGDRLLFGSEIKALQADPALERAVDPVALRHYLSFEYVPSPASMLRGVEKLAPGAMLTFSPGDGRPRCRRYWDLDLGPSETAPPTEDLDRCAAGVRDALHEAVRLEMISDVPVGVFLSGGIDSSAVAAMMSEIAPGQVQSFSVGFGDASFDESKHARLVAQHLGTKHHELLLEPQMLHELVPAVTALLDEPMADASIIPTYLLCRFTRQHVKVALGGDGGDEMLAGYPTLQAHRLAGYYRRLPGFVRSGLVHPLVDRLPVNMDNLSFDYRAKRFVHGAAEPVGERHRRWMGSFTPQESANLLTREMRAAQAGGEDPIASHLASGLRDPLNQVLYLDAKLYLENDILVKLDRASMMNSLEARVPLLNVGFVEHLARLPMSLKLRGLRSKYIFKRALRGVLPAAILERPKKGFGIPIAKWFRGPLRELLLDTLERDRIRSQGFFDWPAVEALLQAHLAGRRDHRKELWTLFVFQRWYDTHIAAGAPVASMEHA